jgi:hypothetical protein
MSSLSWTATGSTTPERSTALLRPSEPTTWSSGRDRRATRPGPARSGTPSSKRWRRGWPGGPSPTSPRGSALPAEILHLLPNGFSYPTTSCLAFLKAGHNVAFEPIRARRRKGQSKIRALRDGMRFLLIILKIVTLYSPLKVFFPVSAAAFVLGSVYGGWNVWAHGKIPNLAALLIQLAVVVFLFGLISEQIAAGQDRK